jgi:CRISPR-associated protein Cas1
MIRKTNRSGRGDRRRSGGDGEPDLFKKQLSEVVQQAFAAASGEEGVVETTATPEATVDDRGDVPLVGTPDAQAEAFFSPLTQDPSSDSSPGVNDFSPSLESLPARMLNEFVYCPRLFYYEHVEGVFVESADTVKGAAVHARVDKGSGAMPKAKSTPGDVEEGEAKPTADGDEIHSRSVMLGSERLGVVAKMDLVETTLDNAGNAITVCPVDYKVGSPREGENGLELWDTDRMQLGLQCLLLRDNGYACDAGIIYYRGTKQRVRLDLTSELEAWVIAQIGAARIVAAGPIPPPLVDSPKCARCSLAPVCLPDETRMLSIPTVEKFAPDEEREATDHSPSSAPRRLIAPRDEKRALYLNTQGFRVGCNDAVIKVKDKDRLVEEVRLSDVCHVAIFGNIQMSTQAVQRFCDRDIPVTWFSMGGWFYGMTRGHSLKNVLLRIEQFRHAADPASCLRLAQQFVRGKINNHRVLFMRNHVEPPERTKLRLGKAREDAVATRSLEELLGVEGAAAAVYFQQFGGLIREQVDDDYLEGIMPVKSSSAPPRFSFDFTTRNRRPPTDPVNAMLSLAYSMLAKECTLAACAVGFDPYVGFYHQPRHGRPALALDIMEEFRPLIAESTVLTAINNRFVSTSDFVAAGHAVNLSAAGRKQFFQCFEQRMNSLITHPVFDYKVSYRRAIELQFRILARVLTGEIPEYIPFMTR